MEQTHESIKNQLIEEAYEVVDAIDNDDIDGLIEELGDVLLHVLFHGSLGKEDGYFNVADIIESISNKMIFRHPHIFGNEKIENSKQVLSNWEELKKKEKNFNSLTEEMNAIAKALPSTLRAHKVQKKAARIGFDFENINDVAKKVKEELNEVLEVYKSEEKVKIIEELGDLLFSCVNLARILEVDEEEALNLTTNKFIKRFSFIEERILQKYTSIKEASLTELDELWEESKKGDNK